MPLHAWSSSQLLSLPEIASDLILTMQASGLIDGSQKKKDENGSDRWQQIAGLLSMNAEQLHCLSALRSSMKSRCLLSCHNSLTGGSSSSTQNQSIRFMSFFFQAARWQAPDKLLFISKPRSLTNTFFWR